MRNYVRGYEMSILTAMDKLKKGGIKMVELSGEDLKSLVGQVICIDGTNYKLVDIFPNFSADELDFCPFSQVFRPVYKDPFPLYQELTAVLWDPAKRVSCSFSKKDGLELLIFNVSDMMEKEETKKEVVTCIIGIEKNGKQKNTYIDFMTESEAQRYTVSLYSRVSRQGYNSWYYAFNRNVTHVFSASGWSEIIEEVKTVRTELI